MKYNEKYDRYVDDDLVIYRWSKSKDKLVQCSTTKDRKSGYIKVYTKLGMRRVHRVVYETFIGEIPDGYEIDHINTVRDDNRIENLRCVTPKENCNNPLTLKHRSVASKNQSKETRDKIRLSLSGRNYSEFGRKFFEHYKTATQITRKLYQYEYWYYYKHNNKCRWEK